MTDIDCGDSMGMIGNLFNNATSFAEGFGYPHDREWRMLNEESEDLILRLDSRLNDEEKALLKDILEIGLRISTFAERKLALLHGVTG